MSKETARSIDELLSDMTHAVDRADLLENLMLDHAKACGESVTTQSVNFFAEQVGKVVFDMYECMNELRLVMDVEAHRKI